VVNGEYVVAKAPLTVTADPATRVYGDPNPAFKATISGFVNNETLATSGVTGAPSFTTTAVANSAVAGSPYPVTPLAGTLNATNYSFSSFVNGNLTVTRAPLTVKADDKAWTDDRSAPTQSFYTRTVTGFKNGETLSSVALGTTTYALSPAYRKGSFGTYLIIPSGTPNPANYTIVHENGTLYVNDDRSKRITTSLKCVEVLSAAEAASSGFQYKARFAWSNPNSTFVYVPLSPTRNFLEGPARRGNQNPPELFSPGTGEYWVYFDGQLLTWVLVTNSENSNTTSTSSPSATAASPKCTIGSSVAQDRSTGAAMLDQVGTGTVQVYPNPVTNRLMVSGTSVHIKPADIAVFDLQGKRYAVNGIRQVNVGQVELDLTNLSKGVYMIRVQSGERAEVFRVIKQ
jgi:hypothetical protein